MNKKIKTTNIDLTPAISDYIDKRFDNFERFIDESDTTALCEVEVGKITERHKSGDIFRAEVNLTVAGKSFYAESERTDLYSAIDEVKDEISRSLKSQKSKSITLARKGALQFKNIVRGITNFNKKDGGL